jgi:hypothetical protein
MHRRTTAWGLCIAGLFLACGTDQKGRTTEDVGSAESALTTRAAATVPWGTGARGLSLRASRPEALAYGPSSIAVADDGRIFVTDGEASRIAILDGVATGAPTLATFAPAPHDVRDLALAKDGALAYTRTLSREVAVLEPEGTPSGTLQIASSLGDFDGVAFGPSRRVIIETPFQESFTLGSAHAPMALESTLIGKKEGVGQLSQARRVSVVHGQAGDLTLRVHGTDGVTSSFRIPDGDTGHVVGARGDVACVRIEHVAGTSTVSVTREIFCANVTTKATVLRADLGAPGLYVPRRELALGAGKLVFMKPTDDGLNVTVWNVEGAR